LKCVFMKAEAGRIARLWIKNGFMEMAERRRIPSTI
jgi:hypothetical protein